MSSFHRPAPVAPRHALVTVTAVAVLLNSCADHPSLVAHDSDTGAIDPETDTAVESIVGGSRDRGAHPAVLALSLGDGWCTGSLVGPRLILTARHCVSEAVREVRCDLPGPQVLRDRDPRSIAVLSGDDVRTGTELGRGVRLIVPRSNRLCEQDVAVVVLDRDVRGITPLQLELARPVLTGDLFTAVGFGRRGSSARAGYGVRYQRPRVAVIDVSAREFLGSRAACGGDSGGPAIDPSTGRILGVLSRGTDPCAALDATAVWTRATAARALLESAR
jgi:hypothetical protein